MPTASSLSSGPPMGLDLVEQQAIAYLRSPAAIRDRCGVLFERACKDQLQYFSCDQSRLNAVADYVLQVTLDHYPTLEIPFHSRWRHFEVGDGQRLRRLDDHLSQLSPLQRAQAKFDLAIVSVLLDAGAGATWQYCEPETGQIFQRSEGLAVASVHAFCQGMFSSDPATPMQVDAIGLQQLSETALSESFQVRADNPLLGIQGRVELLQRLGTALLQQPHLFGSDNPRPGYLVNYLLEQAPSKRLAARTVLSAVLEGLGDIWPERITLAGVNLGDVWAHSALPGDTPDAKLVPFHKLSQWLTYSLLEPLQELGIEIQHLDELTGLPEYRNGGLCLDLGLLQLKDPTIVDRAHPPSSEVIVEWRALTVVLLDQIATALRQRLNLTAAELPLAKVLQGGTWAAGRRIAATLRGGNPPLQIDSDGTVF